MFSREIKIFLIVGILTVAIDYLTYRLLQTTGILSLNQAKAIGFMTGTFFSYIANRYWTFGENKHANTSLISFIILYVITLQVNVWVNHEIITITNGMIEVGFLVATVTSALLNFVGMKFVVFKRNPSWRSI